MSDANYTGCGPITGCWHRPEIHCVCRCHEMARLFYEVTELRTDLSKHGDHTEECSAPYGSNFPCTCGWSAVEARLN